MTDIKDQRKHELSLFVSSITGRKPELVPLNGDASFRRYFKVKDSPYIAVDAPPSSQKNEEFFRIDEDLAAVKIKVPKIYAINLNSGYMVLEDLGNITFATKAKGDILSSMYEKAVDLLPRIARIRDSKLPEFDREFINTELSLFKTWMLEKYLKVELTETENQDLDAACSFIADELLKLKKIPMHRDYHSRNLMVCENDELAVIDFQDMVNGPFTYDLASILFDCYVNLDDTLISSLINRSYKAYCDIKVISDLSLEQFTYALKLTSLQRHIKVLGIFCRLSLRDGKDGYLKDLPRVINYVLSECDIDPRFAKLKALVEKYVKGKF
ncbi:MAG: aminoglycoside phosphotransferase family protein [Succinivibrio sp.]